MSIILSITLACVGNECLILFLYRDMSMILSMILSVTLVCGGSECIVDFLYIEIHV